ncbi:MAG: type IV toxin-antitoxin system AbiEi family antitoxin domain-containing protein [Oscillospiraceae bacterium]
MTKLELLDQLATEKSSILRTADAVAAGVSKPYFYNYVKERGYEQAQHGVFVSPDAWVDSMYLLQIRCPQAVFSHETALYLHDMTDREPVRFTLTAKSGYNASHLTKDNVKVYTVKEELLYMGLMEVKTPFDHTVQAYDAERTVCDIVRSRSNIEMQTFQGALKAYVQRSDKDMRKLMRYAEAFHVDRILRNYLEVLI